MSEEWLRLHNVQRGADDVIAYLRWHSQSTAWKHRNHPAEITTRYAILRSRVNIKHLCISINFNTIWLEFTLWSNSANGIYIWSNYEGQSKVAWDVWFMDRLWLRSELVYREAKTLFIYRESYLNNWEECWKTTRVGYCLYHSNCSYLALSPPSYISADRNGCNTAKGRTQTSIGGRDQLLR